MLSMFLTILFLCAMLGTVNTGISSSLRRPQTFHVLTYLKGGRNLAALPQRGVLIGIAKGTATAGVVVPITDPGETDTLFGIGTPLALMARQAFKTAAMLGQGPFLYAVPLAETTTAKAETFTITGPATGDGDLVVRIAGRYITVGVANGQANTVVAAALNAAINAQAQNLPGTSGVASGVVTFTAAAKGSWGNDIVFSVEKLPPGIGCALAQSVAGVGAVDMQSALDAIAAQDFDGVAVINHASADITEINAHIAATWTASEKKPRWFFIGEPGTQGTATPLATSANHEGVFIVNYEQSPSLPCEISTSSMILFLSKDRPNANFDGSVLPIYPPPIAFAFTTAEQEAGLNAGVTPLVPVIESRTGFPPVVVEGVSKVVRLITSRTTLAGQPSDIHLDPTPARVGWYMAKQVDIAYATKFGPQANPGGVLDDDDTLGRIKDMVVDLMYAAQDQNILKKVDDDKALLLIEDDPSVAGRVDGDITYHPVGALHQAAFVHRVTVG